MYYQPREGERERGREGGTEGERERERETERETEREKERERGRAREINSHASLLQCINIIEHGMKLEKLLCRWR